MPRACPALATALVLALLTSACTTDREVEEATETVTLAAVPNELSSLVYLAETTGAFEEEGLDVRLQEHEVGKLATEALLAGEADFATAAEYIPARLAFEGRTPKILASLARADILRLVGRRDRGIHEPADLAGKRIGVHRGTNFEFLLDRFLLFEDVPEEEVTVVDVRASASAQALLSDRVDAVFVFEPIAAAVCERLGADGVLFPGQHGEEFYWVLQTTDAFLGARPGVAERLLRALHRAERQLEEGPEDARARVVARLGLAESLFPLYRFDLALTQALLLTMENEARWLLREGRVGAARVPNYLECLHLSALERVKPDGVTVIR